MALLEFAMIPASGRSDDLPHDCSIRGNFNKFVASRSKRVAIGQTIGFAIGSQLLLTTGMRPAPYNLLSLKIEFDKSIGLAQCNEHMPVAQKLRFVISLPLDPSRCLNIRSLILAPECPVPNHISIRIDFRDGIEISYTDQRITVFKTGNGIHMHPTFRLNTCKRFPIIRKPFP